MGDIDLTLAVRGEEMERGLRKAEQRIHQFATETGRSTKKVAESLGSDTQQKFREFQDDLTVSSRLMRQLFGVASAGRAAMYGAAASVGIATKAIHEYAKVNDMAAAANDRLSRSSEGLLRDIGRDISPLIPDATSAVGGIRSARSSIVNTVADNPYLAGAMATGLPLMPGVPRFLNDYLLKSGTRGQAAAVESALKAQEEASTRQVIATLLAGVQRESSAAALGAKGDRIGAIEALISQATRDARMAAATAIPGAGVESQQARDQFISMKLEPLYQQRSAILRDIADQERRLRERGQDAAGQAAVDEASLRAAELRLQGRTAEADKVELIAHTEERIRRLRQEDLGDQLTNVRIERGLRENLDRQINLSEQNDLNRRLGEKVSARDRDASASRAIRLEEQMTKAQELRLRGRDREADQLEVQAQFEKRIKDVVDTDFSSPAEADRYRGRLRMLMGDQIRMLGMLPPDRTASIGSGGYSAGIGRVAFGNGLNPGAAGTSPEAELKRANQTLKDISNKLDRRGAVFN